MGAGSGDREGHAPPSEPAHLSAHGTRTVRVRRAILVLTLALVVTLGPSLAGAGLAGTSNATTGSGSYRPVPTPASHGSGPIGAPPVPEVSTASTPPVDPSGPTIDGQNGTGLSNACTPGSVCVDGPSCFTGDDGQGAPWSTASCILNLTTDQAPDVIILFFNVETNGSSAVTVTVTDSESLTWTERASFAEITPAEVNPPMGTSYATGCPDTCILGGYEYWAADFNSPGVDEITIGFSGLILSPPSAMAFGVSGVDPLSPFDAAGPSVSGVPESDYPGQSPATGTITTDSDGDLVIGLLGLENTTSSISTGGSGFEPIGAGAPAPVASPSITLSPPDAGNGNTVTITGSGFSPSDTSVSFTGLGSFSFDCEAAYGYVGVAGLTTPCTFVVPTLDIGTTGGPLYTITAVGNVEGGAMDTASAPFDLTPPDLGISANGPTSGPAGTWVELTGSFFDESTGGDGSVTIEAAGVAPFTCAVEFAQIAVGCYFQIPSGASAPYVITAYGSDYSTVPTDLATTTFEPTYDFSSEAGTLSWGEDFVPATAGVPYAVSASGSASGNFQEWGLIVDALVPCAPCLMISSTPLTGPVGTLVDILGTGFTSGETISPVEFGGTTVQCEGGMPTVEDGTFTCAFYVPTISVGTYSITAYDPEDGTVTSVTTFNVILAAQVTITKPASLEIPQGGSITVKGTDWTPGDGADLAFGIVFAEFGVSCDVTPTINAAGTFTCTIAIPWADVLPGGESSVYVRDENTGVLETSTNEFTVVAPSVTITKPVSLEIPQGGSITITGTDWTPGDGADLAFGIVFAEFGVSCDATPTINAAGTFTCTIAIPWADVLPGGESSVYVRDEITGAFEVSTNEFTVK